MSPVGSSFLKLGAGVTASLTRGVPLNFHTCVTSTQPLRDLALCIINADLHSRVSFPYAVPEINLSAEQRTRDDRSGLIERRARG